MLSKFIASRLNFYFTVAARLCPSPMNEHMRRGRESGDLISFSDFPGGDKGGGACGKSKSSFSIHEGKKPSGQNSAADFVMLL